MSTSEDQTAKILEEKIASVHISEPISVTEEKKVEEKEKQEATQEKDNEEVDIDDIDNLADTVEKEDLNVTADERSQADEDELDPQLKAEYDKFMQDMQKDGGGSQMQFLNQMMGQMFGAMNPNAGGDQNSDGNPLGQNGEKMPNLGGFQNQFGDMFKNFEDNPEYDQLANHLLQEFMDKDILEEPLLDSQKKYVEFLDANINKLSKEEITRYQNQQRCVDELLQIVRSEPNNKDKMIAKFEEMQEYGQPPETLVNAFGGDSPFAAFTNPQGQGQQVPPNLPGGMPGSADECTIF